MFSFRISDRLKFFVERQFVKGAHYQFLVMAIVLAFFSFLGGVLVLGTEPGEGLAETVWWAFLRLSDPGYLGDDVGLRRRFVSTILTMSGYVLVLGTVVAILTRWLISFMRQLEQGRTPIVMEDHILVVGWTDRTVSVLRELLMSTAKIERFLAARGRRNRVRLAVMADEISSKMAHELRADVVISDHFRDVILRSGSALQANHLQRVASLQSGAIIVPTQIFDGQSQISSDVKTIKTLLTLEGLVQASEEDPPYVVAEIQDARKLSTSRRAYTGPLEIIAGDAAISELIVQALHHPGLCRIYAELLSAESGSEFVIHSHPGLAGHSFDDAARLFDDALLCGVVRPHNGAYIPHLNPSPRFELDASDELVFIASPNTDIDPMDPDELSKSRSDEAVEAERQLSVELLDERSILVLGWSQKVITLLRELGTYRNERVDVTVVSTYSSKSRMREIESHGIELSNGNHRQIEADYTVHRELAAVKPEAYDDIVLLSSDRVEAGEESDARTIAGYLCLQEVFSDVEDRPHVLVELVDDDNEKLLGDGADEVIVSSRLVSHMLAQVAMHRGVRAVIEELFTAGGAELAFREPSRYDLCEQVQNFRQLSRRVRRFGETLVGIDDEISPPPESEWSLDDGVRLIALTTVEADGVDRASRWAGGELNQLRNLPTSEPTD